MKNLVLTAMVVLVLAVGAQAAVIESSAETSGGFGESGGSLTLTGFTTGADTDLLLVALGGMFKNSGTLDTLITDGPKFGTTALTQLSSSYAQDGTVGWDQHTAWYYSGEPRRPDRRHLLQQW